MKKLTYIRVEKFGNLKLFCNATRVLCYPLKLRTFSAFVKDYIKCFKVTGFRNVCKVREKRNEGKERKALRN